MDKMAAVAGHICECDVVLREVLRSKLAVGVDKVHGEVQERLEVASVWRDSEDEAINNGDEWTCR